MKRTGLLLIAFIFAVLSAVSVSAQQAKEGEQPKEDKIALLAKWNINIAGPGQDIFGTLNLEKDGDNYKGSVVTDLGEAPLKDIKIDGDSFTAGITASIQGQVYEGTVTGKLEENVLKGEINLTGIGALPYTGKKNQ